MLKQEIETLLLPEVAFNELARYEALLVAAGARAGTVDYVHLRKRSIDGARPPAVSQITR